MKLLIITQKVDLDDENLGFFHRWLEEFSRCAQRVTVIANAVGKAVLPPNVAVHSLGKERGIPRVFRFLKYWRLLFRYGRHADAVFYHMIPEFVPASWPFTILYRKPSVLWYVHKSVTRHLQLAERLVDYVCTASDLSFRLPSKKVIYTGHAIDTGTFVPNPKSEIQNTKTLRLLTVGRISPVKDVETILRACAVLKETWDRQWVLSIVGGPLMPRDREYLASLKMMVNDYGLNEFVHFFGPRPYTEIPDLYREHDLFLSMSTTGSLDKSVLEAMSVGLTTITANEAFQSLLPEPYFLENRNPELLAARIKSLADENRPNAALRNLVVENHSLEKTVAKIMNILNPKSQ